MKKIIYIVSLCVTPFLFNSCEDAYDIERHGILDPTTVDPYITMSDVRAGLNDVYGEMNRANQIALASIWTDECGIGYANGGQGISDGEYSFQMTSESNFSLQIWYENYGVLNAINRFLDGTERYQENYGDGSSEETTEINELVAQAKVIRAYTYLDLLSYYSTDMTDDNALGVMNLENLVPELTNPVNLARVTNGEIFDFIEQDLEDAEMYLADNDMIYVNPATINAIKARMALYRGHYTDAITYAQAVMDEYSLVSRGVYRSMFFTNADTDEVIFKLKRVEGQYAVGRTWSSINSNYDGSPFFEIGRSLFNSFDENDIRYSVNVGLGSVIDENYTTSTDYRNTDVLLIGKYKGTSTSPNDLIVFRVAEMYLIKAEAQANLNFLTDAATTLQEIRNARFSSGNAPSLPTYASKTEALADVLDERRIEFAFEGHRYLDLKRIGSVIGTGAERDPMDCQFNGACYLDGSSYKFTLPIPSIELGANPAISGQQNTGY